MVFTVGQELQKGQYTIEGELGRGRFAITYLARMSDGTRQVLKVLNPQVLADLEAENPAERERMENKFWAEATDLAGCSGSSHIVQAYRPFREDGVACLPMEYIDGGALDKRADRILSEVGAEVHSPGR